MILTKRQIDLIKSCIEKGFISHKDLKSAYATNISRKEFLERLKNEEFIEEKTDQSGKFFFTEKIKEI